MLFTPRGAITRNQFEPEELNWLSINEFVEEGWGQCLQTFDHDGHTDSVAFSSRSSTLLASSDSIGIIKIWDTQSGQCLQTLDSQEGSVLSLAFSPDDTWLAVASSRALEIWTTRSWQRLHTFEHHNHFKHSVAFSPSGTLFASSTLFASGREGIKIWATDNWQYLHTLESNLDTSSVAFSSDGTLLASGGISGRIEIWDTIRWKRLKTFQNDYKVNSVAFSPKMLVYGGERFEYHNSGNIRIWDVGSWESHRNIDLTIGVRSVIFSNDSTKLLSGAADGGIHVWDMHTWQVLYILKEHQTRIESMSISRDNAQLASGSSDGSVKVWNMHSPPCLQTVHRHTGYIDHDKIDFSPDGTVFVSGGRDGDIMIWDAHTGKCLQTIQSQSDPIQLLTFSPNGTFCISFRFPFGPFEVWEPHSWQCLRTVRYDSTVTALRVVFSPDGVLLVVSHINGSFRVWNTQTWECLEILDAGGNMRMSMESMVFSPSGKLFAGIVPNSPQRLVKIWDAHNWHCVETIKCQDGRITSLFFSPHDTLLAWSSSNPFETNIDFEIWDVHSWKCVQKVEGYGNYIIDMDFAQSCMQTNRGIFPLPSSSFADPHVVRPQAESETTHGRGFGISEDGTWITWNSANLLKLPFVYKLSGCAISKDGTSIGIGCESGHVVLLHANCD